MMEVNMGNEMREGRFKKIRMSDDDLFRMLVRIYRKEDAFSPCRFGLIKALLDNLSIADGELKLEYMALADSCCAFYWEPVLFFQLQHFERTATGNEEDIFSEIVRFANHVLRDTDKSYHEVVLSDRVSLLKEVVTKYLFRIVEALYDDTEQAFYSFSGVRRWIQFHPAVYQFLLKNKNVIEKLNYIEYAVYLGKRNPGYGLIELLRDIDDKTLDTNLTEYRFFFDVYADRFEAMGLEIEDVKTKFNEFSLAQLDRMEDAALIDKLCNFSLSLVRKPSGAFSPVYRINYRIQDGRKVIERNARTAARALSMADFCCEIDAGHETFLRKKDGIRYTEPLHLVPLTYAGRFPVSLDVEANIVSLCPTCRCRICSGEDIRPYLKILYGRRREKLEDAGIRVTFEELLSMYET